MKKGFTLIELLVVMAIMSLLGSIIISSVSSVRNKTYAARARNEFKSILTALELYYNDHGSYPPDVGRNVMPAGLGPYLAGGAWPVGPWPGSVYDWNNYPDPQFPGSQYQTIAILFCPSYLGDPSICIFPSEPWAANFGTESSIYYCMEGTHCRSHSLNPPDYPGYCINCTVQPAPW
jgi:prepilin-type N-terminal cleavage/methylation domain-containing protein